MDCGTRSSSRRSSRRSSSIRSSGSLLCQSPLLCLVGCSARAPWLGIMLLAVASATVASTAEEGLAAWGGAVHVGGNQALSLQRSGDSHSTPGDLRGASQESLPARRSVEGTVLAVSGGPNGRQGSDGNSAGSRESGNFHRYNWDESDEGGDEALAKRVFAKGKTYLWVHRDRFNWCGGERHFMAVLGCYMAEAEFLGRRLVLDPLLCISPEHNNGVRLDRPMEAYYNLDRTFRVHPAITHETFIRARAAYVRLNNNSGNPVTWEDFMIHDSSLVMQKSKATVVARKLGSRDFYPYICRIQPMVKAHWGVAHHSFALDSIADRIAQTLDYDFDTVHVRRGDKMSICNENACWPNLDNDTKPEQLMKTIPKFIPLGRSIYITTNERTPGFFDPLKKLYRVHLLQDFSYLWNQTSEWYNATRPILGAGTSFDMRMQTIVEYNVFQKGKTKVNTFPDLCRDQENGRNITANLEALRHRSART